MAQRVNRFNKAFGNCLFCNRENAAKVIAERIEEYDVFADKPTGIKMERIDEMHDRLSLTFSNGTLDGIVTWRKALDGHQYVLSGYEVTES
jgi:hypothetical protein